MKNYFEVTREIGIDAGHRVPNHHSKCKNLHGHRYTIQATCRGELQPVGSSQDMVVDFGHLKDCMVEFIHSNCDHSLILWIKDPLLEVLYLGFDSPSVRLDLDKYGSCKRETEAGHTYIVPFVPTAEALARHWFELIQPRIDMRTKGLAQLVRIKVWETPNSYAEYPCE